MTQYRTYGPLDDRIISEGDKAFAGVDSFVEAESLQPGFVQQAENMRMDGLQATVRKGWDFLAATASGPLNTFSYSGTDMVFASGRYSDPDDDNKDWLVLATKTKAILWNEATPNGLTVNYDTGTNPTVTTAQLPMVVQAFNQVYIMRLGQRPLVWDGATAATGTTVNSEFEVLSASASGSGDPFPSTNFAIYTRNRLVGSQPPTVATPTTAKTGAQTIVASDLLTPNNVNSADSEFYLNFGSADWFVGAIPYLENQLLVFLRNSVHCITNLNATSISEHFEITREYGCVAPRSIAQSGAQTYFLSDQGVMVMTPQADPGKGMGIVVSKVQGEAVPLSRPIQNEFADVNLDHVHKAAGAVYDNHYYLSLPTGSDTTPKTVAVYSILQKTWVSKDTYPDGIEGWVVMPYGSNPARSRLFATMPKGFYLMEQNLGLDDSGREIGDNSQSGTTVVGGKLKTRNYNLGNLSVKRWNRGQLGVNVKENDAFTIAVNTQDPDTSTNVLSYTAAADEEALVRFGSRARGFSCNVEVTISAGSPTFRHVSIDATEGALSARREVA
ncbi:hypothetical protein [uncultured Mediterranean phage]|nr:hypothetical protein [uncultured Mediterranean phage]